MNTPTPTEYAAFLESLRVKTEGPTIFKGWAFDIPIGAFIIKRILSEPQRIESFAEYLIERIRRTEANAKPPTLVEDVKAFMRGGMKAAYRTGHGYGKYLVIEDHQNYDKFSELSEPSK